MTCPECNSSAIRWLVGVERDDAGHWISIGTCQNCGEGFRHIHPDDPEEPRIFVKAGPMVSEVRGPGARYTPGGTSPPRSSPAPKPRLRTDPKSGWLYNRCTCDDPVIDRHSFLLCREGIEWCRVCGLSLEAPAADRGRYEP